jgi:hypothetical protein
LQVVEAELLKNKFCHVLHLISGRADRTFAA